MDTFSGLPNTRLRSRHRLGLCIVAVVLCQSLTLQGQKVQARQGNIYYIAADRAVQITSGGMDYDPSLSPDGRSVVFVRRTSQPAKFEEPSNPNPFQTQIWMTNLQKKQPKMLLGDPVTIGYSEYVTFSEPKLDLDNRHLYFLINLAAVEFGLVRLDIASRQWQLVSGTLEWDLILQGNYAGNVVIQRRKVTADGISRQFWLLTPQGMELGIVGDTSEEAKQFVKNPNRQLRKR